MMKKIIVLLLLLFLFSVDVKAETLSDELPLNKSIFITNIEERYRWYKLNKANEHYVNSFEHKCKHFDEVDSYFSEWSLTKPEERNNRTIEEKTESINLSNREYNTVIMDNFAIEFLELQEIILTNGGGVKYPFKVKECVNCVINVKGNTMLNRDSKIVLELTKNYTDIMQIELRYEKTNNILFWRTTLLRDNYPIKSIGVRTVSALTRMCSNTYCAYKLHALLTWDEYYSYSEKQYRFKDDYVNCYDYEREYADGYFKELNGYIKDDLTKTYFYESEEPKKGECKIYETKIVNNCENDKEEIVDSETEDMIAINYGSKKQTKEYSKLPFFIISLGLVLMLLIIICRKIRLNIKSD